MSEPLVARYWCHACSRMVNPVMDASAEIKCPSCGDGFVEEMEVREADPDDDNRSSQPGLDHALSVWAPILFNVVGASARRRPSSDDHPDPEPEDLSALLLGDHRRRGSSSSSNPVSMLELLQGLRLAADEDDRERVTLLNPGGGGGGGGISLGDYFVGSGFDALLQHLAENDPNRHGSPPARKEAVEALPTVRPKEGSGGCPVCLEELEAGGEGKEMPCGHVIHSGCLLPWLELHSSCPVCRFQLPVEEAKGSSSTSGGGGGGEGEREGNGGRRATWPWPLSALFSSEEQGSSASGRNEGL